jgi:hypothetical protein
VARRKPSARPSSERRSSRSRKGVCQARKDASVRPGLYHEPTRQERRGGPRQPYAGAASRYRRWLSAVVDVNLRGMGDKRHFARRAESH